MKPGTTLQLFFFKEVIGNRIKFAKARLENVFEVTPAVLTTAVSHSASLDVSDKSDCSSHGATLSRQLP